MNPKTEQLRNLPSVDQLLNCDWAEAVLCHHSRQQTVQWIRQAIDDCRKRILSGDALVSESVLDVIAEAVRNQASSDLGASIQHVINATGILLHTNLGRTPLGQRAIDRMMQAAWYSNVELNLNSGRRSRRGQRCNRLLAELTGAEDAIVVNNCAAATMLVLQSIAGSASGGQEVIISRGQLVEIGGGFRLPDVFRSAGVRLREIGTTNRTYLRDYEQAITEATGAILRVHRSNFAQSGFVTEPSISEMVLIDRPDEVPVIDDIGSGCIHSLTRFGLNEPTVIESVDAGADLTLFSGDKLFGGPQCGIVVGHERWISMLRRSPMMRAIRCDKLTLAGVEATSEIHLAGTADQELPLMCMMARSSDSIHQQCLQLKQELAELGDRTDVAECQSPIGGGSIPGASLPSWALRISGSHIDHLADLLRSGSPAIQPRVVDDCVWIDLRTVLPQEIDTLKARLQEALRIYRDRE